MDLGPIEERANEFATWIGKFDSAHRIPAAFASAADVPALVEEVKRLRAEVARPAPAWDEEAVVEAVATALHGDGCPEDPDEGESCACSDYLREARIALAVVRDHLPVKPSREDVYRAWHGTEDPWGGCADSASIERVLDLLPGRSEVEVKAEALREWVDDMTGDLAATKAEGIDLGRDYLHGMRSALMQATERADRLGGSS